mmetsp:Transcript_7836/g.17005  ORF Transcript_7836/g.17005 Transcript_7836/m.17005 type:complete len:231 (-) Transcript_7836:117-809(-)
MSTRPKKRTRGELGPSQFATCIENGLNIHAHDKQTAAAAAKKSKEKSSDGEDDDPATEDLLTTTSGSNSIGNDATKNKQDDEVNKATTTTTNTAAFPRAECTNGAIEALRQCHSAFLSALSTKLGAHLNELESSSSKVRLLTPNVVMACMEEMGLSDIAQRAMASLDGSDDNNNQISLRRKKKRRKKNPFEGSTKEELIAEQERLLMESAKRIQMMNGQNDNLQGKSEDR